MAQRTVVVGTPVGLHARPATLVAQAAAAAGTTVTIARTGGEPVDAASMISLMSLGLNGGDEVVLTAEGDGADAALDAVATLVARDLDAADQGASA